MKFYGIEIGCSRVFPAEKDYETIAITTFGEDITQILVSALRSYSHAVVHEGQYDDIPQHSPNASKIGALAEEEWRPHHTYHYQVAEYLLQSFLNTLSMKLPSNSYISLDNK